MDEGFSWIYLIFFLVPLARIIPRLVKRWQKKHPITDNKFAPMGVDEQNKRDFVERPQTKEMQVLRELNMQVKDFNKIQKNLDINNQELESILKNFEEQGLMKVVEKKGIFGNKIELYPTEKGYKKYYS